MKLEETTKHTELLGQKIGSYNAEGEVIRINTITKVFESPDFDKDYFVCLLDNGKKIVMHIKELKRLMQIEGFNSTEVKL